MEREDYMREALALAREAAEAGEVPVGCVIVRKGEIVGRGRNRREEKRAVSSHAEMEAMAQANEALGAWRLDGCELYVTLEPCPMCAGAILNARIPRVFYGARDPAFGACGMMPRNTVTKDSLKRLHIYAGADYEQQAQKPVALDVE